MELQDLLVEAFVNEANAQRRHDAMIQQQKDVAKDAIEKLYPRISKLIELAETCRKLEQPLSFQHNGGRNGGSFNLRSNRQLLECDLGVYNYNATVYNSIGINWDGIDRLYVGKDFIVGNNLKLLQRFPELFDDFESEFYECVQEEIDRRNQHAKELVA